MLKYGLVQDKKGYYLVCNDVLAEDSWVMISTDGKFGFYPPSKILEFPYDGYFIFEDTHNGFKTPSIRVEKHRGWLIVATSNEELAPYGMHKLEGRQIERGIMLQEITVKTENAEIQLRLDFTHLYNAKFIEE